ncbi:hypothetical protein EC547_04285 [Helicobacter pylori]|uniref:Uncharacterized protein n=1 Tax=Helicobacter pylori TaxID=210 RepID=A0AB37UZA9_HELPX|nr:hypothetical protein EC547_04285 [Helicobacter pylori]
MKLPLFFWGILIKNLFSFELPLLNPLFFVGFLLNPFFRGLLFKGFLFLNPLFFLGNLMKNPF